MNSPRMQLIVSQAIVKWSSIVSTCEPNIHIDQTSQISEWQVFFNRTINIHHGI